MPNVKLADQTIGSTATLIAGDSTYPRLIKPARTIWLGATNGVTVANGEALGANQEYTIDPGETKYAICTEDTDISVIEIRYDADLDAAVTALAEDPASAFAASQSSTFGRTAYNLRAATGLDATTNIHALIAAAVAAGHRYIVVPYRAAAWPATTTLTLSGVTLEFEPGARISFNMAAAAGMDLTECTLIGASFTSIYTGLTSAGDWPNYSYPARSVILNDNNRIEGGYYHEYATTGLYVSGAHNRVGATRFANLRHRTGWAEAIHCDGTGSYDNTFGHVIATNCDRACEIEDGAHDITFTEGGSLTNIYPSGYTGQPTGGSNPDGGAYATYTFVLDGHSHENGGGVQGIVYDGTWLITNCGGGVTFIRSTGTNDADLPRDCRVGEVRFVGRGLATGYEDIAIQGRNIHVERAHFEVGAGIAGSPFKIKGYASSSGNTVGAVLVEGAATPTITDAGTGLTVGPGPKHLPTNLRTGKYLRIPNRTLTTGNAMGNGTLRTTPFHLPYEIEIDQVGIEILAGGDAGCVVRLSIFSDNNGLPGDPLIDVTVAADAIATPMATLGTALVLPAGWYHAAGVVQGVTTTQPTIRATSAPPIDEYPIFGPSLTAVSPVGYSKSGVTGALPAYGTSISTTNIAPVLWVRHV